MKEPEVEHEITNKNWASIMDVQKVTVGPKTLTMHNADGISKLSFQKRRFGGDELLEITFYAGRETKEAQYCNLGHKHEDKHVIEHKYGYFSIPYEKVQQLREWLELGSWTVVEAKRKNENKRNSKDSNRSSK